MKCKNSVLLLSCLILCLHIVHAQDKTVYEFGKITAADFKQDASKFDSGANAVIISEIGSTSFEANNQSFFTLVFKRYVRVKILNKNGFGIGNYELLLYHNKDDYEKLYSIKGSTFNLEGGVIQETKLDEKSVFSDKYNKDLNRKKFSMPALKEGAIYDLEYTVKSPFYSRLRPWHFQGEYPCLWSEYVVTIPPPFHYMMRMQGDNAFDVNTTKPVFESWMIKEENGAYQSEMTRLKGSSIEQRWVKKNVPGLHKEPYISAMKNYYAGVSYQLNYFQWKMTDYTSDRYDFLENWSSASKTLLQDEDFGLALDHVNTWMTDELKEVVSGASSNDEKARMIYNYVRNNFNVVDKEGYRKEGIWTQNPLKDVFKAKEGNVAEINLLLTAMMRHEGIKADPLILSTRDNGIATAVYPLIDEYNYLICVAYLGDKMVTLDASRRYNDFGQLTENCYNGYGHVMNQANPVPIDFLPDSAYESNVTSVFINNDEKGKPTGNLKSVLGKNESYNTRAEIFSSSEKSYQKKIQTAVESDLVIENFGVDSLRKYQFPLAVHYDFDLKKFSSGDIIYMNPMLKERYETNPFTSMVRHYPVDMPYKIDETYLLNMEIPAGYQVEEMPKSVKVAYNENEGIFEYLIQKGETNIQMRVRLKFNKAYFPTEEYSNLRDFFAFVVKKESEQIVFKKIK